MKTRRPDSYRRPRIKTVPARQVIESMGPVSCGSGGANPYPDSGGVDVIDKTSGGLSKLG
jgi:hypothetical protein